MITGYSGDTFPNFTPNPWFAERATGRATVEVEHWSFLAFAQRLEAAARGLPAIATRSIAGSSMEANDAYADGRHAVRRGRAARAAAPDVAILHAPVADRARQRRASTRRCSKACGARSRRERGAIVTVERVVDDLAAVGDLVRIPAHRVLAVCEAPMGAHPGGLYAGALPVDGYGEDYDFWVEARAATRGDDYDDWIRHWVLDVGRPGRVPGRGSAPTASPRLRAKAEPDSWQRRRGGATRPTSTRR